MTVISLISRKVLAAAVIATAATTSRADNDAAATVRAFVDAYTAHDIDAMVALAADDLRWLSVDRANMAIEDFGKDTLRTAMLGYFENIPSTRSRLDSLIANGDYVSAVERASWEKEGETKEQCSVAVYHVVDNLVSAVWYYPATPCEE